MRANILGDLPGACIQVRDSVIVVIFFFFNDTATTEIYTLSLHDALPICARSVAAAGLAGNPSSVGVRRSVRPWDEERSGVRIQIGRAPRLNSSHANISYAVFCLKKKNIHILTYALIYAHSSHAI